MGRWQVVVGKAESAMQQRTAARVVRWRAAGRCGSVGVAEKAGRHFPFMPQRINVARQ